MLNLTLVLNYKTPATVSLAGEIRAYLERLGFGMDVPADKTGYSVADCEGHDFNGIDMAVVLGGDGTLLAVCRYLSAYNIPILVVNMGKLGFLAEVEKDNIFAAIDKINNGEYFIEERMMLDGIVKRNGECVTNSLALNDFVVNDGEVSRSIILELFVDEEPVYSFRTDGLIVSTPTGSTAYSLSAGGPIVMPQMRLMIISPICPHNFFSRPVIIDTESRVRIAFRSASGACRLTADGQSRYMLERGDEIIITCSQRKTLLVRLKEPKFFTTLNTKLTKDHI